MRGRLARPQPAAAETRDAQRALALQGEAINSLPEAELRRLLTLTGGMDPAALQRAAAAYTEMFCVVAGLEASRCRAARRRRWPLARQVCCPLVAATSPGRAWEIWFIIGPPGPASALPSARTGRKIGKPVRSHI
jgi:hypothetical protein